MSLKPLVASGAAGFVGGALIGLVGWGGAQVVIPSLHHPVVGATGAQAAAVSLCALSMSAVTGGVAYALDNSADLLVAGAIGAPAMLGARQGVRIASKLSTAASGAIFNGLSVIMIPTHFAVQHYRRAHAVADADAGSGHSGPAIAGHVAFGYFQGVSSAVMGVGGLPMAMSYLTLACPTLPHHLVQGTAMASVVPGILASGAAHLVAGNVPYKLAAAVAVGSSAGATVGARGALNLDETSLRDLYMASLVVLGGRSVVAAAMNVRTVLAAGALAAPRSPAHVVPNMLLRQAMSKVR